MLLIDTHVHLYGCFGLGKALESAFLNLLAASKGLPSHELQLGLALTERAECNFFEQLENNRIQLPPPFKLIKTNCAQCLLIHHPQHGQLHLFAGRQYVSNEGLEVLGLASTHQITESLSLQELVQRIIEEGSLPALPWSPGKWMFKRGNILRAFLSSPWGSRVVLSDSSLRAKGVPFPEFSVKSTIIHGSDPLPFAGEEARIGSYASLFPESLDPNNLRSSLLTLLRQNGAPRGNRLHIPQLGMRLVKNKCVAYSSECKAFP